MDHTGDITGPQPAHSVSEHDDVLRLGDECMAEVGELLGRFGMRLVPVTDNIPIPGSYWGDEEAGLVGNRLMIRNDTPVHSALHEACHFLCMDTQRREKLHTDAGGDYDEENAVCYLQILLADQLECMGRDRMFSDMDRWGYSFRLGSARAWFNDDADDARQWLQRRGHLDRHGRLAMLSNGNPGQ